MTQSGNQIPGSVEPATDVDSANALDHAKDLLQAAAQIMNEHCLTELEVSVDDVQISLRAGPSNSIPPSDSNVDVTPDSTPSDVGENIDEYVITAPMIGTFYVAAAPGEAPYVQPGDSVEEGQTIGIIEAMKIMNEIASDRSGEVVEVLAENGETVEFGSPLMRLKTR